MADDNAGAAAPTGTAAGAGNATLAGSPEISPVISETSRLALGLPDATGPQEDGGAPQHGTQGGPADGAGQPSTGEPNPKTDASAGAEGSQKADGKDGGQKTEDGLSADDPEVIGLLGKWGLKAEAKATKPADATGAAAGQGTPDNEAAQLKSITAEIEKAIRGDGNVPLDQQANKAVAMAAAGQHQIGKLGNELGPLRMLRDTLAEKGWFSFDDKGRPLPNLVAQADHMTPEEFAEQINTDDARAKLAARGLKLVPLDSDANAASARLEEAVAARLVPGKELTHEERMAVIDEDKALMRRFVTDVASEKLRADADAGSRKLQGEAKLTQARQEVMQALDSLAKDSPGLWELIGPGVMEHGRKLPATLNHQDGLAFALGRAFYEQRETIIRDAINLGVRIGRKKGQGDAGLIIGPAGGGGASATRVSTEGDGVLSDKSRAELFGSAE